MKKIIYACLVIGLLTACTTPKPGIPTVKPTPPFTTPIPPGQGKDRIKPEKDKVLFGAKEDTIIIKTAGDFSMIHLFDENGNWLVPMNPTRDTLEHTWTKIVNLPYETYVDDIGETRNSSKQIKIIVFKNETGEIRIRKVGLSVGNNASFITVTQSAQ